MGEALRTLLFARSVSSMSLRILFYLFDSGGELLASSYLDPLPVPPGLASVAGGEREHLVSADKRGEET